MLPLPHRASTSLETLCLTKAEPFFLPTHEGARTESAPRPTSPDKEELTRATPQSRNDTHPSNTKPVRQLVVQQSRRPDPRPRSDRTPSRGQFLFPHGRSSLLPKVFLLLGPFALRLSAPPQLASCPPAR